MISLDVERTLKLNSAIILMHAMSASPNGGLSMLILIVESSFSASGPRMRQNTGGLSLRECAYASLSPRVCARVCVHKNVRICRQGNATFGACG